MGEHAQGAPAPSGIGTAPAGESVIATRIPFRLRDRRGAYYSLEEVSTGRANTVANPALDSFACVALESDGSAVGSQPQCEPPASDR
jgi:hypothetical protein